jgi:hypothetical protein
MKHVCVTARIGADAKRGAAHIANMSKPRDKVRADSGCNPIMLLDISISRRAVTILAGGGVPALANIPDIRCGLLLASSQNRDSASRVSFCQAL